MKLVFYWDGLEETYEGETWKECCEECVSQEENWDRKLTKSITQPEVENWNRELTKIMIETQTGDMEDATEEVNAYYNVPLDASIGLEE